MKRAIFKKYYGTGVNMFAKRNKNLQRLLKSKKTKQLVKTKTISPVDAQSGDLEETKDEIEFDTYSIKHSLLAARSPKSKTSTWTASCLRRLKLLTRVQICEIDWYENNTRHHVHIFEQHNLARDIRYVWSFFSGSCPEFLALQQYIYPGFHYIAIDKNIYNIHQAERELSGISQSCSTEFIWMDLAEWVKKNIVFDRNARHLLYFGHPYLLQDSEHPTNWKQIIADIIMKFKNNGCDFDLYAGFYYEAEFNTFWDILKKINFQNIGLSTKEIRDYQVISATRTACGRTEEIQPNRYGIIINSKRRAELSPSHKKATVHINNETEEQNISCIKKAFHLATAWVSFGLFGNVTKSKPVIINTDQKRPYNVLHR